MSKSLLIAVAIFSACGLHAGNDASSARPSFTTERRATKELAESYVTAFAKLKGGLANGEQIRILYKKNGQEFTLSNVTSLEVAGELLVANNTVFGTRTREIPFVIDPEYITCMDVAGK